MLIEINQAKPEDKEFILNANKEILVVSGLTNSSLEKNIDEDLLGELDLCKCLVGKRNNRNVAMCLYSDIYWADNGRGIYLSQIYVEPEYRGKGIVKRFLKYIMTNNPESSFITCLVGPDNLCMQNVMDSVNAEKQDVFTYVIERDKFEY